MGRAWSALGLKNSKWRWWEKLAKERGLFICQLLCLLACLGAQIVQGNYFWQILSASQATNTLTLWRNTAKILSNILELFKKYYWQIVTASQMLIQQQLLVLVFCRKARGFTFRNISFNFNSLMIVGQHYSFVIPIQWQNIVFLIFETSSFSYLISEYKVLKIFHICLKIPFCLGLSL